MWMSATSVRVRDCHRAAVRAREQVRKRRVKCTFFEIERREEGTRAIAVMPANERATLRSGRRGMEKGRIEALLEALRLDRVCFAVCFAQDRKECTSKSTFSCGKRDKRFT